MKPRLNLKLFAKFFWGISDDDEKQEVYNSEESDQMLKEHWEHPKSELLSQEEKELMLSKMKQSKSAKLTRLNSRVWRIAAVIVLLITIGGLYQIFVQPLESEDISYVEKSNPAGQRSHFILPDNSVVWLNAQSTIIYPESFEDLSQRKIELKGEAYFEVTHRASKPFVVETDIFDVEVLGTSFNVKAYEEDEEYTTTLTEGKVKLSDEKEKKKTFLNTGEMYVYNKKKQSTDVRKGIDTEKITSWKDGKLVFDDVAFSSVAKELERWYGTEIELTSSIKGKYSYTMTITDEKLKEVCQLIKESSPVEFDIQDNKVKFTSIKQNP
ncbi:MAG: FecR family protein [Bacteroidota bacterium]